MPKLIDEDAFWEKLGSKGYDVASYAEEGYTTETISEALGETPAVDAVSVVRCKGCKWRGSENCAMFYRCECGEQHTWETDNDYCSYGEK